MTQVCFTACKGMKVGSCMGRYEEYEYKYRESYDGMLK
jgi:hypothetical protein